MLNTNGDVQRRRVLGLLGAMAGGTWLGAQAAVAAPAPGKRRIGVALGSGGLQGYAHIGVIRAFEALGFRPDVITGTGAGAIAGVLWASGARANTIEALTSDPVWRSTQSGMGRLGVSDLTRLREFIERNVAAKEIRDLRTRFGAVATDLDTGDLVLLDYGSPGMAVAASSSVPLRYAPVRIDGRQLVDGALTAPIPVDAARALGADFVVAVDIASRPYEEPPGGDGRVTMAFQMMHIMIHRVIEEQLRRADFAIQLDLHSALQGARGARALIAVGERAARDAWPALQHRLAGSARRAVGGFKLT